MYGLSNDKTMVTPGYLQRSKVKVNFYKFIIQISQKRNEIEKKL